jgi:hypothetical protein
LKRGGRGRFGRQRQQRIFWSGLCDRHLPGFIWLRACRCRDWRCGSHSQGGEAET